MFQLPDEKKNLPKAMKYISCLSHWTLLLGLVTLQYQTNTNVSLRAMLRFVKILWEMHPGLAGESKTLKYLR